MREGFESTDDTIAATQGGAEATGDLQRAGERRGFELGQGAVVGRYVVLSKLGAGGMGVVYAAYDPELDRKVALKLLLPGRRGTEGRTRLLREAQALAKLQHPNVVTIHDVGTHDDRVWMAMEFVEGQTLGQWCAQTRRRWAEVLEVLVRAGRGVAAAHAAGLLHRDLKPDNVMVATDGRVRVMDFGLARSREPSTTSQAMEARSEGMATEEMPSTLTGLELRLTQTGQLMGTPAYMAPEQFRDAELGPATDQFGFCATAWEALFGVRPFVGEGVVDLAVAVLQGKRAEVPRRAGIPGWLRRVLDRGLSVDPGSRWSSMEALLEALARGQTRARWRRVGTGMAAVGAMAAGVFGWQWLDQQRRIAGCEAEGSSIEEAWNDDIRERLRGAVVGTEVSHAETTAAKVMPWLDAYAQEWRTARTQVCLEAEVHGRWDAKLHARAQWCLDDRRMELEALVEELSHGEARAIDEAVQAAAGLARLEPCLARDALERTPVPPSDAREEVRTIRAARSKATALWSTGAYEEGLEVARAALERAQVLEWPPLVAETRLAVGILLDSIGTYEEAEEALEAAYFEAAQAGATEAAASAAEQLVYTVGYRLARHADALRWSRHAEVAVASLSDPAQTRLANHLTNLALLYYMTGEHEEAKGLYEQALAIQEKALGSEHPRVAAILNNVANMHAQAGEYEEAKGRYERVLAIREKTLGPEHPSVATSLNNLANVHQATGGYEEAKRLYERALGIREKTLGPDHPDVAASLHNLATVRGATGKYEEAKRLYERALAIREKALGPEHLTVAQSLNNLAIVHHDTGEYEEAKGLHERALAIREKALGSEHPNVAQSLNNLALVHRASGEYEEAKGLYERALAIWEKALGADHPNLAHPLVGLARVALEQGRTAEAVSVAERAVEVREAAVVPPAKLAQARFVLARALWDADRERSRALGLAQQAREAWREAGSEEDVADVDAWLQARRGAE